MKISRHTYLFFLLFVLALLATSLALGGARAAAEDRAQLMAFYLYHFLLFVDWPEGRCDKKPFLCIQILGDPELARALLPLEGTRVKGRMLVIEALSRLDKIPDCSVLFVGKDFHGTLNTLLASLKGKSILTFGDREDFLEQQGMVGFSLPQTYADPSEGKRFHIHLGRVREEGFGIRSRLLRLSDVVQ